MPTEAGYEASARGRVLLFKLRPKICLTRGNCQHVLQVILCEDLCATVTGTRKRRIMIEASVGKYCYTLKELSRIDLLQVRGTIFKTGFTRCRFPARTALWVPSPLNGTVQYHACRPFQAHLFFAVLVRKLEHLSQNIMIQSSWADASTRGSIQNSTLHVTTDHQANQSLRSSSGCEEPATVSTLIAP